MSLGRLVVAAVVVVLGISGLVAVTELGGGGDQSVGAIALDDSREDEGRRQDGDDAVAAVDEDDDGDGDGDGTNGNDGTAGGDNTGVRYGGGGGGGSYSGGGSSG
jgi:hypothetical protein